jgi:hypothetical protein
VSYLRRTLIVEFRLELCKRWSGGGRGGAVMATAASLTYLR